MFSATRSTPMRGPQRNAAPPTLTPTWTRQGEARWRIAGQVRISFVLLLLAGLSAFVSMEVSASQDDRPAGTAAATPSTYEDVVQEGRFLGDPDAPVNFVYFSDYQCPHCKNFDEVDLPPIIENFVESGDVRVEWRPLAIISGAADIPLESPENESVQASEAAMCAADQDQFWPYSEALFAAQGAPNSGVYADDMLKETAEYLDLDTELFNECLDSGEMQEEVIAFREDAIELDVRGTPTFLIDDQLVNYTELGYERLEQQLDAALDGDPVEN